MGLIERLLEELFGLFMRPLMRQARRIGGRMGRANARLPWDLVLNSYRVGDYSNALALCNLARSAGMDMGVFKGELLLQLGQMDEAVETLTAAVAAEKDPKPAALANCVLGQVYLFQQRLDKAQDCFTAALNLWPERAATHRSVAEVWLRRESPSEALRWARLAVEKERADPGVTPETKAANLATDLAVLALATAAASGDASDVEKSATEAAGLCGGLAVSSVAQVHVYCGLAYKGIGNAAKATEHFELAARVDPRGAWGREAQGLVTEAAGVR
jgi:tetratricopeptide (TPR) repeat protein